MNNDDATDQSQYLKYAQAAVLLSVKVPTLYSWVSRGLIPHVRLSPRVVRFRRDDLERWLEQRRFLAK